MYIPIPCHENWSKMTAVEQGRYCAQCNKVVVDMRRLSEEGITALRSSGKAHCGLFYEDQLSATPTAKGWLMQRLGRMKKEWLVASLLAMLQLTTPMEAQADTPRTECIHHEQRTSPIDSGIVLPGYIQGRVSVKEKQNVHGAYNEVVYLYTQSKKLIVEMSTDTHGFFAFAIPDSLKNESFLLVIKKYKSRRGRYVRHSSGAKQLTDGGSWIEMQVHYTKRKKLIRKRGVMGCPKFR